LLYLGHLIAISVVAIATFNLITCAVLCGVEVAAGVEHVIIVQMNARFSFLLA
jgi:uncharacterized membrane protein